MVNTNWLLFAYMFCGLAAGVWSKVGISLQQLYYYVEQSIVLNAIPMLSICKPTGFESLELVICTDKYL